MFLKNALRDNPKLIQAAVQLHQAGNLPPNTFVYDLDTVTQNARHLAKAAKTYGLKTYLMTKQFGRNPFVAKAALHQGLDSTVAVDIAGARILHRYGLPVGHMGHLSQVPMGEMAAALEIGPDVMTVYSVEAARRISSVAAAMGKRQDLLIKVVGEGDLFFPGQESGVWLEQLAATAKEILSLPNIDIAGVTAFPCVRYNNWSTEFIEPAPNLDTLIKGAQILREDLGLQLRQINAPGNTSCTVYEMLATQGVTHVEPGNGLTATTPEHITNAQLPERTASVYLSEISHHFGGKAYCFGGGLYVCLSGGPPGYPVKALVGDSFESCRNNVVSWEKLSRENIDYYGMLTPGARCRIGDSVVFGFRSQAFFTRAYTAAVSGIQSGDPVVEGVFDSSGSMLDEGYEPVPSKTVMELMDRVLRRYPTAEKERATL